MENKTEKEITSTTIESKILTIRSQQVMIDRDLAELYGTETKVLNQAVKRNRESFFKGRFSMPTPNLNLS